MRLFSFNYNVFNKRAAQSIILHKIKNIYIYTVIVYIIQEKNILTEASKLVRLASVQPPETSAFFKSTVDVFIRILLPAAFQRHWKLLVSAHHCDKSAYPINFVEL